MQLFPCRSQWHILLENSEVGCIEAGSAPIAAKPAAVGAWTAPPPTEIKPMGLRSKFGKEKQLVLDDWSAYRATVTVAVKARVRGESLLHPSFVDSIQVAVSEIFVNRSVKGVGAALYGGVELTAGRVTEVGVVLV